METKYFVSKKLALEVTRYDEPKDGKQFTVKYAATGEEYGDAGILIGSIGGCDIFWQHCITREQYEEVIARREAERSPERVAARKEEKFRREAEIAASITAEFEKLKAEGSPIQTTPENIGVVLRYLNTMNWGAWELPAMSVSYSANQYDCDGNLAATMTLDEPIIIDGEEVSRFVVGAPFGHLNNYRRV